MSQENIGANQMTDGSAATEAQANEYTLLSPEEIEALRTEAKAVYEKITENAEDADAWLKSLKSSLDEIVKNNNLANAYGDWFAQLIQDARHHNENTRPPDITDDSLIRLSREMSRQKLDFEQKKKDADELDGEIAGKQDELNELNRRIDSEYREKCKAKEDEIAALDKQIKEKKDELEDLKRQIEDGSMLPPEPLDPDSLTKYEAACIEEFDREGFIVPKDRNGEIYLCGEFGYADITGLTPIGRERLMSIDQDAEDPDQNLFRYMGRPQFYIKKVQSGMFKIKSHSPHYPNTVDGEPLSCSEEMDLRQGSVIEMTDNKKNKRKVKVFISPK